MIVLPLPEPAPIPTTNSLDVPEKVSTVASGEEALLTTAQTPLASGDLETAAQAFEDASFWLEAAETWQQIDRYGKRAEALEQYARQLEEQAVDEEEKAVAWTQAARAHAELRQQESRLRCEREAARHRRQAILRVEIDPEPLVLNTWSKLDFTIHNEGFGAAQQVMVNVIDDRFEGQGIHSQTMPTILPNRPYHHWLDILPKSAGRDVALQLAIEYQDRHGNEHRLERRFYLTVPDSGQPSDSDSQTFARLKAPDGRDLTLLRQQIIDVFDKEETYVLLFDLGLRPDDFGNRISTIARELITYAVQTDRLDELIQLCQKYRPHVDW